MHRVASLEPHEVTVLERIPITTPLRTLVDLASVIRGRSLQQALARAERNGLVDRDELRKAVAGRPGRSGNRLLRGLLEAEHPSMTRSAEEDRLLDLLRKVGLPAPATNARILTFEVDLLWRREGLVVEVDGFAFHSSRRGFESDRRRDATLTAHGFRVMRSHGVRSFTNPKRVLVRVAQALARGADP